MVRQVCWNWREPTCFAGKLFKWDWTKISMDERRRYDGYLPLTASSACQFVRESAIQCHDIGMPDRQQASHGSHRTLSLSREMVFPNANPR